MTKTPREPPTDPPDNEPRHLIDFEPIDEIDIGEQLAEAAANRRAERFWRNEP
jgi:hypothetical protein